MLRTTPPGGIPEKTNEPSGPVATDRVSPVSLVRFTTAPTPGSVVPPADRTTTPSTVNCPGEREETPAQLSPPASPTRTSAAVTRSATRSRPTAGPGTFGGCAGGYRWG